MSTQQNLAARMGRWSAEHWKTATLLWIAFVIVAVVLGRVAGTVKLTDSEQGTGETARAQAILADANFKTPASESVLVESKTLTVDAPAFRAAIRDVAAKLRTMPQVTNLRTSGAGLVSRDRHAQLIQFDMKGQIEKAPDRVQPLLDAVSTMQALAPGLHRRRVRLCKRDEGAQRHDRQRLPEGGDSSPCRSRSSSCCSRSARSSPPASPCCSRSPPCSRRLGLLQISSHVCARVRRHPVGDAADGDGGRRRLLALLLEARTRGTRRRATKVMTASSAPPRPPGQAVLISGITVLIAMAGMLLAGSKIFTSIGIGAMLVVFTALVGSLTVLPALLGQARRPHRARNPRRSLAAGVIWAIRREPARLAASGFATRRTLLRKLKGDRQESRVWGRRAARLDALSGSRRSAVGAALLVLLAWPVLSHAHEAPELQRPAAQPCDRQDLRARSRPSSRARRRRRTWSSRRTNVTTPAVPAGVSPSSRQRALATGQIHQPIQVGGEPGEDRRPHRHAARRQR